MGHNRARDQKNKKAARRLKNDRIVEAKRLSQSADSGNGSQDDSAAATAEN